MKKPQVTAQRESNRLRIAELAATIPVDLQQVKEPGKFWVGTWRDNHGETKGFGVFSMSAVGGVRHHASIAGHRRALDECITEARRLQSEADANRAQ